MLKNMNNSFIIISRLIIGCSVIEFERLCVVSTSVHPLHIKRSSSTKIGRCGTQTQPWVIEAPSGQQINISLLDFSMKNKEQKLVDHPNCQQFGYMIDKLNNRNTSICGTTHDRKKLIYVSQSNRVEIVLSDLRSVHVNDDQQKYLIAFQGQSVNNCKRTVYYTITNSILYIFYIIRGCK